MSLLSLAPGALTLAQLRAFWCEPGPLNLGTAWRAPVAASADLVQRAVAEGAPVYGVNTGFGKLAGTRIAANDLEQLQLKLLRSHAVGVGEPLPEPVVRLALLLKAASLARAHSGVRVQVIEALLALLEQGITPWVPAQGSVGASGDLAPLAHLCLPLIGEGQVYYQGQLLPAEQVLARCRLPVLQLQAKEGLALINGTQISTALALDGLFAAERLHQAALLAGALTLDAARGSDGPFDPRIHALRGQPGQIACAAAYRALLHGSAIRASHLQGDDRVQDPYCLRCQPQVMGACWDQLRYAAQVLLCEANAVTDNPLVFDDNIISGGNFHAEPVALVADAIAVAVAEIGAIAERRVAMLVDAAVSRLPPFLTPEPGLNSGFMIAHVTAAALASENKSLAHPASVDSLPTSANQEDHVSMATFAARRLSPMVANSARIIAIELLAAAQGIEFLRPLQSSPALETLWRQLRATSPAMMSDRALSADIEAVYRLISCDTLQATAALPELHALRLD